MPNLALALTLSASLLSPISQPVPVSPRDGHRVLDTSLTLRKGVVRSIVAGNVRIEDESMIRTIPLSEVAAIVPPTWGHAGAPREPTDLAVWKTLPFEGEITGVLRTTSGEVVPGHLASSPSHGGSEAPLAWESATIGRMEVALDLVRSVSLSASVPPATTDSFADVLTLINGDRLEGFVTQISQSVTVDGSEAPIPIERIALIDLANPSTPVAEPMVWCRDGTVLKTASIAWNEDAGLTLERGSARITLRDIHLRSINVIPSRLIPLSALPSPTWSAPQTRRWTPQPISEAATASIGASPIRLPGPGTAGWVLPASPVRFAATLELPADCRAWGNPSITIAVRKSGEMVVKSEPLWTGSLDGGSPVTSVNVEIAAPSGSDLELLITVAHGARGTIQSELSILDAVILTDAP